MSPVVQNDPRYQILPGSQPALPRCCKLLQFVPRDIRRLSSIVLRMDLIEVALLTPHSIRYSSLTSPLLYPKQHGGALQPSFLSAGVRSPAANQSILLFRL